MGKLDNQITSLSIPLSWFRFIDDVDMKWTEPKQDLDNFITHANNAHPPMKFLTLKSYFWILLRL